MINPYQHKYVEPLTIHSIETEGNNTVIIGTDGLCFWRPTSHFRFMPEVGELFYIEHQGNRILSMQRADGGEYTFAYSEADLAAQDAELLASINKEKDTHDN